ncbi:hypothetical protein DFA_03874 [Cavenderia fasciculata]|uniref:Uncharacterized protein n=1 Tax=Cavenderia fasciculata TaxID=261658 RepID=F4Q0M9_CACFS|nr:uncharacterized protein DFA_03874 [Cavenderia fasciculata]EGG18380.1 hypothetical protein DFA_03874 [Cavenderia fasciculata]|eukprot:XP_004366284.1 hypothetical protein DFA_03874 [Cavenderia fasciculata]
MQLNQSVNEILNRLSKKSVDDINFNSSSSIQHSTLLDLLCKEKGINKNWSFEACITHNAFQNYIIDPLPNIIYCTNNFKLPMLSFDIESKLSNLGNDLTFNFQDLFKGTSKPTLIDLFNRSSGLFVWYNNIKYVIVIKSDPIVKRISPLLDWIQIQLGIIQQSGTGTTTAATTTTASIRTSDGISSSFNPLILPSIVITPPPSPTNKLRSKRSHARTSSFSRSSKATNTTTTTTTTTNQSTINSTTNSINSMIYLFGKDQFKNGFIPLAMPVGFQYVVFEFLVKHCSFDSQGELVIPTELLGSFLETDQLLYRVDKDTKKQVKKFLRGLTNTIYPSSSLAHYRKRYHPINHLVQHSISNDSWSVALGQCFDTPNVVSFARQSTNLDSRAINDQVSATRLTFKSTKYSSLFSQMAHSNVDQDHSNFVIINSIDEYCKTFDKFIISCTQISRIVRDESLLPNLLEYGNNKGCGIVVLFPPIELIIHYITQQDEPLDDILLSCINNIRNHCGQSSLLPSFKNQHPVLFKDYVDYLKAAIGQPEPINPNSINLIDISERFNSLFWFPTVITLENLPFFMTSVILDDELSSDEGINDIYSDDD